MINDYSFNTEDYVISIARNGSVGSAFTQHGKFGVTSDILVLKLIDHNNIKKIHIWCVMLNYYLKSKYNYNNKITIEKLLNEEIYIPEIE